MNNLLFKSRTMLFCYFMILLFSCNTEELYYVDQATLPEEVTSPVQEDATESTIKVSTSQNTPIRIRVRDFEISHPRNNGSNSNSNTTTEPTDTTTDTTVTEQPTNTTTDTTVTEPTNTTTDTTVTEPTNTTTDTTVAEPTSTTTDPTVPSPTDINLDTDVNTSTDINLDTTIISANDITITFSNPENGTVTIDDNGTADDLMDDVIIYTPDSNFSGTDQIDYTLCSNQDPTICNSAVILVTVNQTINSGSDNYPTSGEHIFYVTTTGKSTNSGKTESTAWNIQHAFETAKAGDTVYVKAGLYTGYNITQKNNGTSVEPISFIGYKSFPGDIDSEAQENYTLGTQTIKVLSSFSYGDSVDSNKMPLLQEDRNGLVGKGTALTINGSYIQLFNIQTKYYENGLYNKGDYNVFKNNIFIDLGNFSLDVRDGNGVVNYGNNCTYKNIYIENAADQGFTIQGNYNIMDAVSVVADNTINATDYYFLFQKGHDNIATNIYNFRKGNLQHRGHGITYKTPEECYNNVVKDFIIDNTRAELQFPGVHDNLLKNGYIIQTASSSTGGGLRLANGAYNNTFDNIFIENSTIFFMDWNDGLAGDVDDSSDGNIFNKITIINSKDAVAFNYYGNGLDKSSADNNTFYNCTFYDNDYMFENSRINSNTQFINCIFSKQSKYSHAATGYSEKTLDVSFSNTNFNELGFSAPTGSNISQVNPLFKDTNNYDFSLQSASPLKGKGIATPFLSAGNDLGSFQ